MTRRHLVSGLAAFAAAGMIGAAQQAPPAQPASKGVVIKGRAPVSNEILKVTLPRPHEADLRTAPT